MELRDTYIEILWLSGLLRAPAQIERQKGQPGPNCGDVHLSSSIQHQRDAAPVSMKACAGMNAHAAPSVHGGLSCYWMLVGSNGVRVPACSSSPQTTTAVPNRQRTLQICSQLEHSMQPVRCRCTGSRPPDMPWMGSGGCMAAGLPCKLLPEPGPASFYCAPVPFWLLWLDLKLRAAALTCPIGR